MSSDDAFRNSQYSANRKSNNKSQAYSPSANYNLNSNQTAHGNHNNNHGNHGNHNNHGNHSNHGNHGGNNNYGNQQRRKPSNFKPRDNHGSNDRIIKQNDIIIRLLKEIRDRLPPNPSAPSYEKHDYSKGKKHTGRTVHKQEPVETESAAQKVTGNEVVAEKTETPVDQEQVQESKVSDATVSDTLKNELEQLDQAVNGNLK